MSTQTITRYFAVIGHYGPKPTRFKTVEAAMDEAVSTCDDTIEQRQRDEYGDRPLRRWEWDGETWSEVVSHGGKWRKLTGPITAGYNCEHCGAIAVSDGSFTGHQDHALGCPSYKPRRQRAVVHVNGKVAGEHQRACAVLVVPPGFALPQTIRDAAASTWTDGTGTTTILIPPEVLA